MLNTSIQRMMVVAVANNRNEVCTETCTNGHSYSLSMPEQIVEVVDSKVTWGQCKRVNKSDVN